MNPRNHEKPYSEACERNREPILAVLREAFAGATHVLEIGSGTGQHAAYFARHLPHLTWQTSDLPENHVGINAWIDDAGCANLRRPLDLDVRAANWPVTAIDEIDAIEAIDAIDAISAINSIDSLYTANTLHIMDWPAVQAAFRGAGNLLAARGTLVVYGPFNYNGAFTSDSNARFDASLRARGTGSALRDFEAVDALAAGAGFTLLRDVAMPANNRTLVWRKQS